MLYKTHALGGNIFALGALLATQENNVGLAFAGLAFATLGAGWPDIDQNQSTISRKNVIMGAVSNLASSLSSHRRWWHTPICCALCAGVLFLLLQFLDFSLIEPILHTLKETAGVKVSLGSYVMPCTFYFFLGEISHLVLDSFNDAGVPWLFPIMPLDKKLHVPIISVTTNSPGELIYRGVFALMVIVMGYMYLVSILNINVMKLVLF